MVAKGASRGPVEALGTTALLLALPALISSRYGAALAAVSPEPPVPPSPALAAPAISVARPAPRAVRYPLTRQRRALLATIRFAEGT